MECRGGVEGCSERLSHQTNAFCGIQQVCCLDRRPVQLAKREARETLMVNYVYPKKAIAKLQLYQYDKLNQYTFSHLVTYSVLNIQLSSFSIQHSLSTFFKYMILGDWQLKHFELLDKDNQLQYKVYKVKRQIFPSI